MQYSPPSYSQHPQTQQGEYQVYIADMSSAQPIVSVVITDNFILITVNLDLQYIKGSPPNVQKKPFLSFLLNIISSA